jgi:hypothetical protein
VPGVGTGLITPGISKTFEIIITLSIFTIRTITAMLQQQPHALIGQQQHAMTRAQQPQTQGSSNNYQHTGATAGG